VPLVSNVTRQLWCSPFKSGTSSSSSSRRIGVLSRGTDGLDLFSAVGFAWWANDITASSRIRQSAGVEDRPASECRILDLLPANMWTPIPV